MHDRPTPTIGVQPPQDVIFSACCLFENPFSKSHHALSMMLLRNNFHSPQSTTVLWLPTSSCGSFVSRRMSGNEVDACLLSIHAGVRLPQLPRYRAKHFQRRLK